MGRSCANSSKLSAADPSLRMVTELIVISELGASLVVGVELIKSTTAVPVETLPKMVCTPFRKVGVPVVMKNWEPFVFGPELAIANK